MIFIGFGDTYTFFILIEFWRKIRIRNNVAEESTFEKIFKNLRI